MASILNNVSALGASRQLGAVGLGLQRTIERLTTGKRINRASDDAAGLGISNKLGADIRTAGQACRNANDGISYLQVADGVLEEVSSLLARGRELAEQAKTGTINDQNRLNLNAEFQNILKTLIDIGQNTQFNGASVFSSVGVTISAGSFTPISFAVGTIGTTTSILGLTLGSTQTTNVQDPAPSGWVSDGAGGYRPSGVDFLRPHTNGFYVAWDDADNNPASTTDIDGMYSWASGLPGWTMGGNSSLWKPPAGWTTSNNHTFDGAWGTDTITGFVPPSTATSSATGNNLGTATAANTVSSALDAALESVSNLRASLGASMQQLGSVSNALGIQVENATAAFSQIRDTQLAEEVVSLTRFQILNASGTSALNQANQAQRSLLALLR